MSGVENDTQIGEISLLEQDVTHSLYTEGILAVRSYDFYRALSCAAAIYDEYENEADVKTAIPWSTSYLFREVFQRAYVQGDLNAVAETLRLAYHYTSKAEGKKYFLKDPDSIAVSARCQCIHNFPKTTQDLGLEYGATQIYDLVQRFGEMIIDSDVATLVDELLDNTVKAKFTDWQRSIVINHLAMGLPQVFGENCQKKEFTTSWTESEVSNIAHESNNISDAMREALRHLDLVRNYVRDGTYLWVTEPLRAAERYIVEHSLASLETTVVKLKSGIIRKVQSMTDEAWKKEDYFQAISLERIVLQQINTPQESIVWFNRFVNDRDVVKFGEVLLKMIVQYALHQYDFAFRDPLVLALKKIKQVYSGSARDQMAARKQLFQYLVPVTAKYYTDQESDLVTLTAQAALALFAPRDGDRNDEYDCVTVKLILKQNEVYLSSAEQEHARNEIDLTKRPLPDVHGKRIRTAILEKPYSLVQPII